MLTFNDGTRVKILLVDVNEASIFTGDTTGTITETQDNSIIGTLTVEDEDGESDEYMFSGDIEGEYGVLSMQKDGVWEYRLNEDDFRVTNLLETENLTDTIEVMSVGGTEQEILITIDGYGTAEDDVLPKIRLELDGEGFVGEELRMEIVGEDLDLLETETYSFVWYRKAEVLEDAEAVAIAGATGQSYVLKAEDLGQTITGKLILGRFETETEAGVEVLQKDLSYELTIEGMAKEGETLTATIGDITVAGGDGTVLNGEDFDYEYYWYRDGERLTRVKGESYELQKEDGEKTIKVGVLINYKGSEEAYKDYQGYVEKESGVIAYVDSALEGELSLRGRGIEGELLFVNVDRLKDDDGLEDASYIYQWYRGTTAIDGAVYRSYLLDQEDVGGSISVKVTVTDDEGHTASVSVAVEQLIENVDNPALGRVKIVGTVHEQETITANIDGLSDEDGLAAKASFVYRWFRDGEELEEETGQDLSIEDEWAGSTISVEVSFADLLGNEYTSKSFEREVYEPRIPKITTASLEAAENSTGVIGTLETDFRGRGDLTYTLSSSDVSVDRTTGAVDLLLARDYEVEDQRSFNVIVTVSNELGLSSSKQISIIVSDVDDVSPSGIELLDDTGNVLSVVEATEGSMDIVGTLTAMDPDTDNDALVFSTADGRFSIDMETVAGVNYYVLKADASLDFEGSLVTDGTTMVTITVSDEENTATVESLTITVLDVDDVAPTMIRVSDGTDVLANVEAREGVSTMLGTLVATDADTAASDLMYETMDGRFAIEQMGSGGNTYYVLSATTSLNYESTDVANGTTTVEITVTDGGNNSNAESFTVTVLDSNDEAPENLRITSQQSVKEGEVGVVGTLTADDRDTASESLVYSVGADSHFTVEETSAGSNVYVLKSKDSLDYEDVDLVSDDGTTRVRVTVNDGTVPVVENFAITVTDANDHAPVISSGGFVSVPIGERASPLVIGTVTVADGDRTEANKTINYAVSNTSFSVNALTREVSFTPFVISGADLEVVATITASDGENIDTLEVTVTIDNTDGSTDVEISDQTLRVNEGVQALPSAVVATGPSIEYSVASGADFTIGGTGILSFKVAPNYEVAAQREYNVVVTVTSGSSEASATIQVLVEDVNDESPTGLNVLGMDGNDVGNIVVSEGDVSVLGTLMGMDVDTVGTLTYTITDARFSIEEVSASTDTHYTLRATDSLDFEGTEVTNGTTILQVTVSDGVNSDFMKSLTITVRDVDDEEPENLRLVNNGGADIVNPVGEENGVNVVGTLTADDADTAAGNLVYSTGDSRFMVAGNVLSTTALLDYDADTKVVGGVTNVLLTVTDTGNNLQIITLQVTVTDRDDESPTNLRLVTGAGDAIETPEGDENNVGGLIGYLAADDVDTRNADLVYTTSDNRFSITKTNNSLGVAYELENEWGG